MTGPESRAARDRCRLGIADASSHEYGTQPIRAQHSLPQGTRCDDQISLFTTLPFCRTNLAAVRPPVKLYFPSRLRTHPTSRLNLPAIGGSPGAHAIPFRNGVKRSSGMRFREVPVPPASPCGRHHPSLWLSLLGEPKKGADRKRSAPGRVLLLAVVDETGNLKVDGDCD